MMFEAKNDNLTLSITREEKRKQLYFKQKETLDIFLSNGAITKEQYDFSHNGLVTKMGITKDEFDSWLK